MDLTWLRDFEALVEDGNFSRAAERRHVTQPAFSRRIRSLEDWAGTALFDRGCQPIRLTEAGQRLRPLLDDILRRLDVAREEASAVASGSLRFAAMHALSFSFFPAWLPGLQDRLPAVAIHLMSDGLETCERLMLAGRADFLLCHHHAAVGGPLREQGFMSRQVGRDRLRLVSAPSDDGPESRFRRGDHAAPILGYGAGSGLGRIVAKLAPDARRPVFTSHLAAALRTMAIGGAGLAWLPQSLIRDDLCRGRLVPAAMETGEIDVGIMLFRSSARLGAAGQAFWQRVTATDIDEA